MPEGARAPRLPVPPPLDDEEAGYEADIRRRGDLDEPLTAKERAFLARLPAHTGIPAEVVREAAKRAGGVEPRPAALHPEDAASGDSEVT